MFTLMTHIPNVKDATSWYRGVGPLAALQKSRGDFVLTFPEKANWPTVEMASIAFFQRPHSESHLEAIEMSKRAGTPIWVDYDDLLFEVPEHNEAAEVYDSNEAKIRIGRAIAMADVVTVSTAELKRQFQRPLKGLPHGLNKNVYHVPNALKKLFAGRPPKPVDHKIVTWRGSASHKVDLLHYSEEIIDLSKKHPDWTWVFIGYDPVFLTQKIKKSVVAKSLPIDEYYDFIKETAPAVHFTTLSNSPFNRCKSNISWMEGTWAGAACIGPDFEEWTVPGLVAYDSKSSFFSGFDELLSDDHLARLQHNTVSWAYIKELFLLEEVNKKRSRIIDCLLGKAPWPLQERAEGVFGLS